MEGREKRIFQHIDYLQVLLRSCTSLSLLYALVATCGVMAHGAKTPENFGILPGAGEKIGKRLPITENPWDKCSTWEVGCSHLEFGNAPWIGS